MWSKHEAEPVRPTAAPSPAPASAVGDRREPAAVGPSISVVGDLSGDEDLTILGRVEGKIDLPKHSVTIGQSGRVKGDIHARIVSVAGEVRGDLVAGEQIVIRKTATMLGNLAAPRVGLEDGCSFRGSVEMESPERGRTPAGPRPVGASGDPGAPAKPQATPARA